MTAVRCYVYARTPGTGKDTGTGVPPAPWRVGVLPGGALTLPHAPVSGAGGRAEAASALVRALTGRVPRLIAPPVPPLEAAGAAWWIRSPRAGPYESEHEYVMVLPGAPPSGLDWLGPTAARATRPHPLLQDENLRLAAALGAVLDPLIAGLSTPGVIRAMTLGHSRRDVGQPRLLAQW
ncbi:hypothetical protein [Streptomyces sp. G-G2]|uniref:hypothetical protein n=1 Tax=Streptomyces sp. G-G2 TaxID=3046201 RepID=UPI0024B9C6D5|nr:hypothetical protein [Streptomyces sp. G-G2]MDJ0381539.1 hypothetical protein [Streptomyces sp. G-G2]